jgi:hypothetical protein
MGKLLPLPYPGQSMDEYREQLVNFKKNYWGFVKPSKGGGNRIPSPPLILIKKTEEMSVRKLNEHLEEELFNKEKRETPKVDKDRVIKTKPKLVKESVLGQKNIPSPPSQEPRVIKEGEQPVKKKKPYYRKKYNKPKPVEIVPEPVKSKNYFIHGLIVGVVVTFVLCKLYFDYN